MHNNLALQLMRHCKGSASHFVACYETFQQRVHINRVDTFFVGVQHHYMVESLLMHS